MEYEDIKTTSDLREYLETYRQTQSTSMDDVFGIFKSDVSDLARDYRAGEVYIYDKEEFLDMKKDSLLEFAMDISSEDLRDQDSYTCDQLADIVEDMQVWQNSKARFFVNTIFDNTYEVY